MVEERVEKGIIRKASQLDSIGQVGLKRLGHESSMLMRRAIAPKGR